MFLGGSEILNPVFLWGIRNSECFPVFLGGSEFLNPVFLWGIRNSESSHYCVLGGIRNSESCVFVGDQKF